MSCIFCGYSCRRISISTDIGESFFCRQCGGVENLSNKQAYIYTNSYFISNYDTIIEQQRVFLKKLLSDLDPFVKYKRLLDVGCGTGLLLMEAYIHGYHDSVGVDISSDAIQIAKKTLAGTDVTIQLSTNPILDQFGVVAFMDSIAHIENLDKKISSILSENLSKDGLLIIKTPRFSKLYFYYGMLLGWLLKIVGKSSYVSNTIFYLPARYYLFTMVALDAFLARHGLSKEFIFVKPEYLRDKSQIVGLKNRIAYYLLRIIPDFLRGGNKSMIIVARKI